MAAQDTADPGTLAGQIDLNAYTPPQVLAKFVTSTVYSLERREKQTEPHNEGGSSYLRKVDQTKRLARGCYFVITSRW